MHLSTHNKGRLNFTSTQQGISNKLLYPLALEALVNNNNNNNNNRMLEYCSVNFISYSFAGF